MASSNGYSRPLRCGYIWDRAPVIVIGAAQRNSGDTDVIFLPPTPIALGVATPEWQ
jgi:hypothetical protein